MFGRWKWVAGVVAYMPLGSMILALWGIMVAFQGMKVSGSGGLGAVAHGIYLIYLAVWIAEISGLVSSIWFTILLGRRNSMTTGKLLLAFFGMVFLGMFIAPICFHILRKRNDQLQNM